MAGDSKSLGTRPRGRPPILVARSRMNCSVTQARVPSNSRSRSRKRRKRRRKKKGKKYLLQQFLDDFLRSQKSTPGKFQLQNLLCVRHLLLATRYRIVHCYVFSDLLNGVEGLTLKQQSSKKVKAFELQVYRRMLQNKNTNYVLMTIKKGSWNILDILYI